MEGAGAPIEPDNGLRQEEKKMSYTEVEIENAPANLRRYVFDALMGAAYGAHEELEAPPMGADSIKVLFETPQGSRYSLSLDSVPFMGNRSAREDGVLALLVPLPD
jgi:hypothetical protein